MLKRIAILGEDEQAQKALVKGVKRSDVQFVDATGVLIPDLADTLLHHAPIKDALPQAIQVADNAQFILYLLAEAIDCRESFKPKSSQRVVEHATRFALALGLDDEQRVVFERGALLRDIGKLRIQNEILLKDGLLTYDEWRLIQDHTTIGADLVKETPGLGSLEEIIRCHHESFDGDGYPAKLEGDNIPYLARALKIIDVYCAMTSRRAYRAGVASKEEALGHLESEKGKHFDPELVTVFLDKKIGGDTPQET